MRYFRNKFVLVLPLILAMHVHCNAAMIAQYDVFSTGVVNGHTDSGDDAPHGLWTSADVFGSGGTASSYYDIQAGTLFTQYDNDTATLIGTAKNPYDSVATIELNFGDYHSALGTGEDYKVEGGLPYDDTKHDFYGTVSGTIKFDTGEVINISGNAGNYNFQFGLGANAKSPTEFGGSAWITGGMTSSHWDLNLVFAAASESPTVPEPTSIALWSIGLVGMGFARRRRS